jgi:formylmethanofuran dehydrogenase subunit C
MWIIIPGRRSRAFTEFSLALKGFVDYEAFRAAGNYLSALIDMSSERDHLVILEGHDVPIDLIGYRNRKNIVIRGDPGRWLGNEMIGGRILVKGSSDDEAGANMRGGRIIIEGDVGSNAGQDMGGGTLIVKGNARNGLGINMYKGKIRISGNVGDTAGEDMKGGEIRIQGNAGDSLGEKMAGGSIIVYGNAGDFAGGHGDRTGFGLMQNPMCGWGLPTAPSHIWLKNKDGSYRIPKTPPKTGEIIIHGNAGDSVGQYMDGTTLRIDGSIKSLGRILKGKVYQRGKLIACK